MYKRDLLSSIAVKNYKSIASAHVSLTPFTVLVGPNGAGKSNFVDVLRFTVECLIFTVSVALQNRGGINAVRRHSTGHPTNFGLRFDIQLTDGGRALYAFEISAQSENKFRIKQERCLIQPFMGKEHGYIVVEGQFSHPVQGVRARIEPDRLALPLLSAVEEYRPIYDFLTGIRYYSLDPETIRQPQEPDPGEVLHTYGDNAAAVLREIQKRSPEAHKKICELLARVVPGVSQVEHVSLGQYETIRFKQDVGDKAPWNFNALNMSDGTLRALGTLLAIYQLNNPTLIVIEEPEATIHPGALEVIVDILKDGARHTQVLVTTHSPDILDDRDISDSEIRAVTSLRGKTEIGLLGPVARDMIRRQLYTAGELLRMGELAPEPSSIGQLSLFSPAMGRPEGK